MIRQLNLFVNENKIICLVFGENANLILNISLWTVSSGIFMFSCKVKLRVHAQFGTRDIGGIMWQYQNNLSH